MRKSKLKQRYAAERDAYSELKALVEPQIVRWRYSNGFLWSHAHCQQDILTTEEAAPEQAQRAYGYDADGRVICVRSFTTDRHPKVLAPGEVEWILTRRIALEEFIRYAGGTMEISEFGMGKPPADTPTLLRVYEVRTEGHQIVEEAEFHPREDRFHHSKYVAKSDGSEKEQDFDEDGKLVLETKNNADGSYEMYKIRKDGSRFLLGQPMPKGMTVKSLTEVIRRRLLEVIPKTVKAARIKEPVYCVALAYDGEGNDVLGPYLGIGLESERKKWLRKHGEDAWQFVWNPAEFNHYEKRHTQLGEDDKELTEASEWLNNALEDRGSKAPAVKLLVEVAAELEKLNWSGLIKTTPDFVVYAVDFELCELRKNLRKIVAPQKLSKLKAAKLL
jgi:hypothetical protein